MTDVHGSPADSPQNPQMNGPGSAPVPYAGAGQSPEPPRYGADLGALADAAAEVMQGIPAMPGLSEQPWAHDIAAGTADAPYYAGPLSPIATIGDGDADDTDDVAPTVQGAVDSATARWRMHMADAHAGSVIGDLMSFPPSPLDPGAGVGNTSPAGGFYDPPRGYGGTQGAPGYEGEAI